MIVWDGSKKDTTNYSTDKYLQINSCGFQNASSGYTTVRKKGRLDYHILLITSGICEVLHKDKLHELTSGNLVVYAPGEEQKYSFKSESTSLWCHFTGSIVKELLNSCNLTSGVCFFEPNKAILESYTNLIRRFHQPGREKYANASLLELIYGISNAAAYSKQRESADVILPILTYINANYNKQLTLDELARKSNYSKSRFTKIFSEITGTTPIRYQNDIRLMVSCEMLSSTEFSIAYIAYTCGFNDPLYYSKFFKKKYGVTPTQYRGHCQNRG